MRGGGALVVLALASGACRSHGSSSTSTATATATATPCPSDLDARTADARDLYPEARTAVVDASFLFVDPDHGPLFDEATRFAPRVLRALRHDRMAPRPLCPASVYLFASHTHFVAHCGKRHYVADATGPDELGVYDPIRREIVVDLSPGRTHVFSIAHELCHVLMDQDFAAPRWFRECVCTQYEAPSLSADDTEIHGLPNRRYDARFHDAAAAGSPDARPSALFGMSDAAFAARGDADPARFLLHYATARATCEWADERGALWPWYRAWRDDAALADGTAAFTHAAGMAPAEADAPWRAWVSLQPVR
ncbi:MAG TPA: hypothetical protein VF765_18435 [Polyangiaceae bacterium]